MGKSASKYLPTYIKSFNIENRALKQVDKMEKEVVSKLAPRHPSTAHIFKKIEESAPNLNEFEINKKVIEASKAVNVYTAGESETGFKEVSDKRVKKMENEYEFRMDLDYQKYGYVCPEKMRPGTLTLRQFDEFVNEFKQKKSIDFLKEVSTKHGVTETNLYILIEYYKPFKKLQPTINSDKTNKQKRLSSETEMQNVFPNIR